MAQMRFFDLSDRYASLDAKKDPLVEIRGVVSWEEFRPTLEIAVTSLLRKRYATCQRLSSLNCPIHRVLHPIRSPTSCAMARAS